MIGVGENSIPTDDLLKVWSSEWLGLMKRYRNHPSLLYWTINNEMNFTHNKDNVDRIEAKMGIVSDVVKCMREVDSTRPICFDSGYTRKGVKHKHDSTFYEKFDDGDIDDGHSYSGWYHSSLFDNIIGKPFLNEKTEGRPMISQEWSTGYPNTETGHHTRSYLWQHQNTQTHVGNQAYPFGDPKYSLENNAFLTSETVEAVRRTHDKLAGMHNFSSITWFQNVYDAERVKPYPTYYRMINSLSPVLVSAELWGRHFYGGEKLFTRFCIVNDKVDGQTLAASTLKWEITYKDNRVISSGTYEMPAVEHYSREWLTPEIVLPENFSGARIDAKLRLFIIIDGEEITQNDYELVVAKKEWVQPAIQDSKKIVLVDYNSDTKPVLDLLNVSVTNASDVNAAFNQKASLYIISGLNGVENLSANEQELIRTKVKSGANVILLNSGKKLVDIFPESISGYVRRPTETAHIDIPESKIFDGIEYMDLRYFNNDKAEKPLAYTGLIQVVKKPSTLPLASACQHRYARGNDRRKEMLTMKGFPIVSMENGGKVILSEMMLNKGVSDPIAAKLLSNMIVDLTR
jgi:beta-galactosidase